MKTLDLLKKKMRLREEHEIKKKIDSRLKKEKREKSKNKPIYIGMTVSEVDKIMGKPYEIITNDSSGKNQLWIYKYQNEKGVALTFIDYKLIKIEE